MSTWRVLLQSLHANGGGPLSLSAFDEGIETTSTAYWAINRLIGFGFVVRVAYGRGNSAEGLYAMTPLGYDHEDGRVVVGATKAPSARGRAKSSAVATWLRALPRAGEIAL